MDADPNATVRPPVSARAPTVLRGWQAVTQRTRPACRLLRWCPRAHGSPRGGGIPPTAQPLVDEIAARPAHPRRATPGATPSIAPTPGSRRPHPPSMGAEEGRPVQRRRRAAPRVQTCDQMRAAASTAADRALIDTINDASSGEEEEEAERATRRNVGLDGDFNDDVAPSPARLRRSTRGGRA
jgi:hypothetical protein